MVGLKRDIRGSDEAKLLSRLGNYISENRFPQKLTFRFNESFVRRRISGGGEM